MIKHSSNLKDADTQTYFDDIYIIVCTLMYLHKVTNKMEIGYIEKFKSFKSILTIENAKKLKVKDIITDFELVLINAVKSILPNVKYTCCFSH